MAICITKVLPANVDATYDFDLTQHLNSVIIVSCSGSVTAGNNILRFYEVTPAGTFNILGSAAAFATTITGPTLVAATSTTPAYARFTTASETQETTLKVVGAYFVP